MSIPISNGFELLISDLTRWKKEKYAGGIAVLRSRTRAKPSGGAICGSMS